MHIFFSLDFKIPKYLGKYFNNRWENHLFCLTFIMYCTIFFSNFSSTVSYFYFFSFFGSFCYVFFYCMMHIDQAFDRGMVLSNMKMKDPAVTWTILFLRMLIRKWVTLYSRMHLGPCLMRIKNNKIKSHHQWIDLNPLWEHNLGVYSLFLSFYRFFCTIFFILCLENKCIMVHAYIVSLICVIL